MIVKNEAENLPHVLASIEGVVDEVVVYDTGSDDDTVAVARAAGAKVHRGHWDDDFARARNAALELTRAEWVLIVDGDDRLMGDGEALRAYLGGRTAVFPGAPPASTMDFIQLRVLNVSPTDEVRHTLHSLRIARRAKVTWHGRVHERMHLRGKPFGLGRTLVLEPQVLHIRHSGYNDPAMRAVKGRRNLELAQAQVDELATAAEPDPDDVTRAVLDLGRSLLMVGHRQEAVEAFETVRDIAAGDMLHAQGIALLAQTLLDNGGHDEAALILVDELRASGHADTQFCDWLTAQAMGRTGRRREALELLRGIDTLEEPVGNQLTLEPVLLARVLFAGAEGLIEEAGDTMLEALVQFGPNYEGNTRMLLRLWKGRESELAARVATSGGPFATDLVAAMRAVGKAGAAVAELADTRSAATAPVSDAALG